MKKSLKITTTELTGRKLGKLITPTFLISEGKQQHVISNVHHVHRLAETTVLHYNKSSLGHEPGLNFWQLFLTIQAITAKFCTTNPDFRFVVMSL